MGVNAGSRNLIDEVPTLPIGLVGDEVLVPCGDGGDRRYVNLDVAASTNALPAVA